MLRVSGVIVFCQLIHSLSGFVYSRLICVCARAPLCELQQRAHQLFSSRCAAFQNVLPSWNLGLGSCLGAIHSLSTKNNWTIKSRHRQLRFRSDTVKAPHYVSFPDALIWRPCHVTSSKQRCARTVFSHPYSEQWLTSKQSVCPSRRLLLSMNAFYSITKWDFREYWWENNAAIEERGVLVLMEY